MEKIKTIHKHVYSFALMVAFISCTFSFAMAAPVTGEYHRVTTEEQPKGVVMVNWDRGDSGGFVVYISTWGKDPSTKDSSISVCDYQGLCMLNNDVLECISHYPLFLEVKGDTLSIQMEEVKYAHVCVGTSTINGTYMRK